MALRTGELASLGSSFFLTILLVMLLSGFVLYCFLEIEAFP